MKQRLILLAAAVSIAGSAHAQDALTQNFMNPPASAKPHTWWHWMNGNISKKGITADLEAMKKVGIGGAQIFNPDQGIPLGDTPYMSPQWLEAMAFAGSEAKRLGLELCFHNCAGWSSSGGPWIDPAHSMLMLTWSETAVTGGQKVAVTLSEPQKRLDFYQDICVLAVKDIKPASISNIRAKAFFERFGGTIPDLFAAGSTTDVNSIPKENIVVLSCNSSGEFSWDAPAGNWTLIRMGYTTTAAVCAPAPEAGRGLECDKLSREAMDLHWEKGIEPILKQMGPEIVGKSLNNSLIDSYEVGSQNWTPKLREEFQTRRGYDLLPWLVTVTGREVQSGEQSERFLWDFRRTIADLFSENYAGRFKELCHKNGMKFSVEPYGNGTFDNLQVGAQGDIPMGEFWVNGAAEETIKIAASSAHVTGRSIVGAESFTSDEWGGRWQIEPYGVKALGDRIFTDGVNRYIFHRYAHQPWIGINPGMTMGPWGTHLERTVTWWNQSTEWMKYIARCQYLLQSGKFVADVLTFSGDDAPNDLLRPSLPAGFDYDGCDRGVLMKARVENGQIVLASGARYRVLILPNSAWMTPQTAKKISDLVKAGATVLGSAPKKSPSLVGYPSCDTEVESAFAGVKLVPLAQLANVLGTPDATFRADDVKAAQALPWIHRRLPDADVYFISNPRYANRQITGSFRVSGKTPELWHPDSGTTETAPIWKSAGNRTEVTLSLGPAESAFVVFRKPATVNHLVNLTRTGVSANASPVIVVEQARYEALDGAGGTDVTAKVRSMVKQGAIEIPATNTMFGDPILNHAKRLRVSYTVNGKRQEKSVNENETLTLFGAMMDNKLPDFGWKNGALLAYTPGTYTFSNAQGTARKVNVSVPTGQTLTAPWKLTFPPHLGAPSSVTLPKLISWTEHTNPGVKYFSGSATYSTTFTTSAATLAKNQALILDLGRVKNFAEVTVNGKPFPTLWKAPWRLDISGVIKPGTNTLTVRVTNLWVNRLIGDEQLPAEVEWTGPTGPIKEWPQWLKDGKPRPASKRVAWTTWRFWTKKDQPLESGLIGPVVLRSVPIVKVQ